MFFPFFVLVAVAVCVGRCGESVGVIHESRVILFLLCKIVSKSLRLQHFARYLFHRICGLFTLTP